MNDIVERDVFDCLPDAFRTVDIKITLDQWSGTIAILGICATAAFVSWINKSA